MCLLNCTKLFRAAASDLFLEQFMHWHSSSVFCSIAQEITCAKDDLNLPERLSQTLATRHTMRIARHWQIVRILDADMELK